MLPSFLQTCAEGAYQSIPHWHQGSDCWCSYQALGTKQLSTSSSSHVLQETSTSCQSEGVLRYEKLWYLFYRYLCVSPGTTQKFMLHDFVKYQNTHSRHPITLLSMDIVVESFLEIGTSDLLVWTCRLQDPLYMEVWETYSSLSIGLGKQNITISHHILLIMSVVEWLMLRITHLCLPFSNFKFIKQVYCHYYNLNLSPTSHELGDALLLWCRSTLFLQEYNNGVSLFLIFSIAQFDGPNNEITSHPIMIVLCTVSVNFHANRRQRRRQRLCWQRGNKVNKNNNNNMTTTQQLTQQPKRQPTWRGNNWAAGKKLCVKLFFF